MNAFKSQPEHGMASGISWQTVPQCNNNSRGTKVTHRDNIHTSGENETCMKKRQTYCLMTRSTRRDRNTKATVLQ